MERKYIDIIKSLLNENIRFIVIGGIACVMYGVKRATFDIDILLPPDESELEKLPDLLNKIGYKKFYKIEDATIESVIGELDNNFLSWILKEKSARLKNDADIDLLIAPSLETFNFIWEYKKEINFEGLKIPIPALLDLIHLKEKRENQKDIEDLKFLKNLLLRGK